eukprot:5915348-Prymnesium_polylepis.2
MWPARARPPVVGQVPYEAFSAESAASGMLVGAGSHHGRFRALPAGMPRASATARLSWLGWPCVSRWRLS